MQTLIKKTYIFSLINHSPSYSEKIDMCIIKYSFFNLPKLTGDHTTHHIVHGLEQQK